MYRWDSIPRMEDAKFHVHFYGHVSSTTTTSADTDLLLAALFYFFIFLFLIFEWLYHKDIIIFINQLFFLVPFSLNCPSMVNQRLSILRNFFSFKSLIIYIYIYIVYVHPRCKFPYQEIYSSMQRRRINLSTNPIL